MKRIFSTLFALSCIVACKQTNSLPTKIVDTNPVILTPSDSLFITLRGIDLSEDMSRLSTKNDEILVLIYNYMDSLELNGPLVHKKLTFARTGASKSFPWKVKEPLVTGKLLFLLIEQDSDIPVEQIDPVIRVYHHDLIEAYKAKDYGRIEKYLGDEDLLGVQVINKLEKGTQIEFRLRGVYKLDKYEYQVKISG